MLSRGGLDNLETLRCLKQETVWGTSNMSSWIEEVKRAGRRVLRERQRERKRDLSYPVKLRCESDDESEGCRESWRESVALVLMVDQDGECVAEGMTRAVY